MKSEKIIRKEIALAEPIVNILQGLAKADGRKVKNYIEKVLNNHAVNEFNKTKPKIK